jgi:hypothetical protein
VTSDFGSRVVYRQDERGVILEGRVLQEDEDMPEGFSDKAEYKSYVPQPSEAAPADESKLTTWDGVVLSQTVDVIKEANEVQEGPSQPGGEDVEYDAKADVPGTVKSTGDEVKVGDGSSEFDASQTVDEIKDEADRQEGPSDPRGEDSDDESQPKATGRRSTAKK